MSGLTTPNSTVRIYQSGTLQGSTKADASGKWEVIANLANGTHRVTATSLSNTGLSRPTPPHYFTVNSPGASPPPEGSVPFYRFYDRRSWSHWYTIDEALRNRLATTTGVDTEGTEGRCYPTQTLGTVPLYHLQGWGIHFYTTNPAERDTLVSQGWQYEGPACYVFASSIPGTTPLHRFNERSPDPLRPSARNFYTIDEATKSRLMSDPKWTYLGVTSFMPLR